MSDLPAKPRISIVHNTTVERIVPELAVAIGLNESIVLLQIDFWIGQVPPENYKDGKWWTFQSIRDMQKKAFPYWGVATVSRTITSLKERGYIFTGNYNKRKKDTTQWFALNIEKLQELFKTIPILHIVDVFQNGTGLFQNGTPAFQNGTTLPDTTPEITPEIVKTTPRKTSKPAKPRKPKDDFQVLWNQYRLTAESLLTVMGHDLQFMESDRMAKASRQAYLDVAKDMDECGFDRADIPALHSWVNAKADRERWSVKFSVKTLGKYIEEFRQSKAKSLRVVKTPGQPVNEITAGELQRAALIRGDDWQATG